MAGISGVNFFFAREGLKALREQEKPMRKYVFAFVLVSLAASAFCTAQAKPGSPATGPGRGGDAKRPMTFEDMMKMKRLGETAVSPDG